VKPEVAADLQMQPAHPRLGIAIRRWRNFCQQWRHCYLLLLVLFWVVWQVAAMAIQRLENIRMGGLHPVEVLFLMDVLKLMWLPPLVGVHDEKVKNANVGFFLKQ
jgi:hypothetical protein